MSEYSKEKLFYLKLNKDFFDKHYIKILETQENGDKYILFLIKLMCESISHNGYLRFNESIPYDDKMLSAVTHTDIDVVRTAIKLFQELEILEITEDRTIFIPSVQLMTCSTTEGAVKKLEQRRTKRGQMSTIDKSIEYRDKSIEKDIELKDICSTTNDISISNSSVSSSKTPAHEENKNESKF